MVLDCDLISNRFLIDMTSQVFYEHEEMYCKGKLDRNKVIHINIQSFGNIYCFLGITDINIHNQSKGFENY